MEELFEYSDDQIELIPTDFVRYLYQAIHWESRLIGIKGGRGTGKTTLLLQYLGGEGMWEAISQQKEEEADSLIKKSVGSAAIRYDEYHHRGQKYETTGIQCQLHRN